MESVSFMMNVIETSETARVTLASSRTTAIDRLCVHELFELQAGKTPRTIAMVHGDRGMTYGELDDRADLLAHYLRAQGVGPDVPVALSVERGFDMVCAVLAVLKAGGAYVPIDPEYPAERLRSMVSQSGATLLLTTERAPLKVKFPDVQTVYVDRDWDYLVDCVEFEPFEAAKSDNLAYVMFTSGSTGEPKGVALPHRALANLVDWQIEQSAMSIGARTLQFASLSFDVSFQEIFSTLCAGGTLVMMDEDVRRDPSALLRLAASEQVERLFLPYVALKQLAEAAQYAAMAPISLREIITAGEQLQVTPALVSFFKKLPHCRLQNQYGPSETHVVTQYTLSDSPGDWPALPPIGSPVPGATLYVLDTDLKPVPDGEMGELYVGGICVARGYLGKIDLTTERFIKNPTSSHPEDRWYKTGDLVRVNEGGELEFLGRADDQIKIRGYRVEPAEVEQVLSSHPSVQQAAIVARGDKNEEQRLTAFVLPKPGCVPEVGSMCRFMETKLPAYMIPTEFVPIEVMPTTPSGKLDRKALAKIETEVVVRRAHYAPPQRDLERRIAAIWSDILNVDKPGLYDNFFDLGGTSVLAVQAHRRLQNISCGEFAVTALFQHPTISSLAQYLGSLTATDSGALSARDRAVKHRAAQIRQMAVQRRMA